MTIQIKNRWRNETIFEFNSESLKMALIEAVKQEVNLGGANLRDADLRGATLRGANLWGADLWGADLRGASLWGATLRGANLWGADLRGVDLRGADLGGADLRDADLRGAMIKDGITIHQAPITIGNLYWPVLVFDEHMQIGCEFHTHEEWDSFDDKRIATMAGKPALTFWRTHKEHLMLLCRIHAEAAKKGANDHDYIPNQTTYDLCPG